MHSSRVYMRLNERLGLHDHLVVLGVMVRKVYFNLRVYRTHAEIIDQTLKLFQDLASGYMSGKQLHRLDAVHYVLCSHTELLKASERRRPPGFTEGGSTQSAGSCHWLSPVVLL